MSEYRIINICQTTIEIINCIQKGASLITTQRGSKENVYLFEHQDHRN